MRHKPQSLFTFCFEADFRLLVQTGLEFILQTREALKFPPARPPKMWDNRPVPLDSVYEDGVNHKQVCL